MSNLPVKSVEMVRWPKVIKEIRGISPLAGTVVLDFGDPGDRLATGLVYASVNDGPPLLLEDCGTYWKPAGLDIPITDMLLD